MKITDVRTTLLTGPSTNDRFLREARRLRSAAFVEIHTTDAKIIGIGETYAGYFCPELVPHVVEFFKPILVGQEIVANDGGKSIGTLWDRMYRCENFWCRVGLGAIVLTALEAAMWDISGKVLKKPVHQILNGGTKHAKLPCYATGGPSNYPKNRLAEKVDYYLGLGFKGFKVGTGAWEPGKEWFAPSEVQAIVDFEVDKVAFLRQHVGKDVNIMFDGHMGNSPTDVWDVPTAKAVLKAFEPYNLFFFEEPLPYFDADGYSQLAASTSVPVAGGECLSTIPEWREYYRRDSFDIAQPDASFVGGLAEFVKISAEFEKRGRRIATHAWGAGGSLMQNINAAFATPNTCMLEVPPDFGDLHKMVLVEPLRLIDGMIHPPQTPGMGVQLTDEVRKKYPFQPGSGEFISVPGKILTT